MFEPSHLVPNLNEMMEEYAEGEEEAVQETQLGVVQEEERKKTKQLTEETKREKV